MTDKQIPSRTIWPRTVFAYSFALSSTAWRRKLSGGTRCGSCMVKTICGVLGS